MIELPGEIKIVSSLQKTRPHDSADTRDFQTPMLTMEIDHMPRWGLSP